MPSYAVIIKHKYMTDVLFYSMGICKVPLYRYARQYIDTTQKPLKVVLGCEFISL